MVTTKVVAPPVNEWHIHLVIIDTYFESADFIVTLKE